MTFNVFQALTGCKRLNFGNPLPALGKIEKRWSNSDEPCTSLMRNIPVALEVE